MKRLMSLPLSGRTLTEYGGPAGLEVACRALSCDGLEVVWAGEDLPLGMCRRPSTRATT